jgi:hypothetical protein
MPIDQYFAKDDQVMFIFYTFHHVIFWCQAGCFTLIAGFFQRMDLILTLVYDYSVLHIKLQLHFFKTSAYASYSQLLVPKLPYS